MIVLEMTGCGNDFHFEKNGCQGESGQLGGTFDVNTEMEIDGSFRYFGERPGFGDPVARRWLDIRRSSG
jgi:hypothetical protein